MKKIGSLIVLVGMVVSAGFILTDSHSLWAAGTLRYSCSAQVYDAFENERLDAFTKKTGTTIDLKISSSQQAVERLANGESDIASSAQRLSDQLRESGLVETPFCKDPLAVITHPQTPVNDLSNRQVKGIFEGTITNWKEVGGPDKDIVVIVPGKETASYRNFCNKVMGGKEIKSDIMTDSSTMVVETSRRFPFSISFITQGAARAPGTKLIRIDGKAPTDPGYPYYQVFSFVTKGEPEGAAKEFIDFASSEEAAKITAQRGMILYQTLEE